MMRFNKTIDPESEIRMDPCLQQQIPYELPSWRKVSSIENIEGFSKITSHTPILQEFLNATPGSEGQLQADELFRTVHELEGNGPCIVEMTNKKKRRAYCKVTHLLDCIRQIQGYYEHPEKGESRKEEKRRNPMNQAYVDYLANYLVGQIRERNLSPHFCRFYGGFQAIAKKYRYNITEEFESYRKYKSFWEKRRKGLFSLHIDILTDDDLCEVESVHTPTSSLHSMNFSYSTRRSETSSVSSVITLEDKIELIPVELKDELESVHSFAEAESEEEIDTKEKNDDDNEEDDDESYEDYDVFVELKDYPVMLMFQEEMDGTLDELLEEEEEEEEKEKKWTAWMFQICAALSAAQGILGMTHNDLHTNNIVWCDTKDAFLFYKNRAGDIWRIPTFGKIFRLIDFGRSIYRIGKKWFVSVDYARGGDAAGMYNFPVMGSMYREDKSIVYPNPSFDLARLGVSILDSLFPEKPEEKEDGLVINEEGSWIVRETISPLYNLLWSWIIDDAGCNILREENGDERFPSFDLYSHGAAHMLLGKPQEQICRNIFESFKVKASDVEDWELDGQKGQMYPLFF
jgi:hypothetical protein